MSYSYLKEKIPNYNLKKYTDIYDENNKEWLQQQQAAYDAQAQAQKDAINLNADTAKEAIISTSNQEIKEAEHAYDDVINLSNVQKLINERQISERMANLGMTDSGLNRTQQTAAQLSHANTVAKAQLARQKQVDALATAVQKQIASLEAERATNLSTIDTQAIADKTALETQYKQNRTNWAQSAYEADIKAENERIKAEAEAEAEMLKAQQTMYKDRNNLYTTLYNEDITEEQKKEQLESYLAHHDDNVILAKYKPFLESELNAYETSGDYLAFKARMDYLVEEGIISEEYAEEIMKKYHDNIYKAYERTYHKVYSGTSAHNTAQDVISEKLAMRNSGYSSGTRYNKETGRYE